jgi:acyl-CoA reductase-like NAD-dependent aldehyde dehydrogenase
MAIRTENYINGVWKASNNGRTFPTYNPATSEVLAQVARSDASDFDEAVAAARAAFPLWDQMRPHKRGNLMITFAYLLQSREDEMAELISREHGKTLSEAHGDVQEVVHVALYYAAEGRRQFGNIIPSEKLGKQGYAMRRPYGVVLALSAWNFPLNKAAIKTLPALILGNTVVLKPAHETPLIVAAFVDLLHEAGFPPGVVNLIQGRSEDIGEYMISHPGIDMISYTGSTKVGRHIASVAGQNLVPVSLELSVKNAMIINSDAKLDLALDWALMSSFATTGQRESTVSRIILLDDIADEFIKAFLDRVDKEVTTGDPLKDNPYMGPMISEEVLQAAEAYVQSCLDNGGRILRGGSRPKKPELAKGYFFEPTVIEGVDPTSEPAMEDHYAPVALLFRVKDLDEAVKLANSTPYGMDMAIFTRNIDIAMGIADRFECGLAWINCGTCGTEIGFPYGGAKDSGIGTTEWGQGALDTFSYWKTTYINYSGEHRFVFEDTRFEV